ncbi:MAG: DUF4124 domain-containing protein [Gallionella sp.]|nr:DUF4124 domain-containing protein [Gallionella sp.]
MTDETTIHVSCRQTTQPVRTCKPGLAVLFIAGFAFSLPVSAKTYKWVDDKGTTHYGETIPAEYANKDRTLLDKSGVIIKTQEVLTQEERRARELEKAKIGADQASARDQKLHDKSLTDTYSNVKEIELSRTRSIQQVDSRINSISSQLKMAMDSLLGLQADMDARRKAGGKIPPSLKDDIKDTQQRVNNLQIDLDKYKAEKQAVDARYDADKARYKELTGK